MYNFAKSINVKHSPMSSTRIVSYCSFSEIFKNHRHIISQMPSMSNFFLNTRSLFQANSIADKNEYPNISYPSLRGTNSFNNITTRGMSYSMIHPEKLKQIIKEKDSQTMCKVFGSKNYQKHIEESVELQHLSSFDDNLAGIPENEIKYEHVIDCAQPNPKPKVKTPPIKEEEVEEHPVFKQPLQFKKPVKTTVMELILQNRKLSPPKVFSDDNVKPQESTILPIVMEARKKNLERKKKFRRRITILPLLLQKKQMREENARRKQIEDEAPLTNYFKKRTSEKKVPNDDAGVIPFTYVQKTGKMDTARTMMTSTAVNNSINPSSSSVEKKEHVQKSDNQVEKPKAAPNTIHRIGQQRRKVQYFVKMTDQWRQSKAHSKNRKGIGTKREELSSSCEMNMPMNSAQFHSDTRVPISHKADSLAIETIPLEYPKGCKNKSSPILDEKYSVEAKEKVKYRKTCEPSRTYKIVSGNKKRQRMKLYERFRIGNKTNTDMMQDPSSKYDEALTSFLGSHMARLPKTTPEGYRVLLYSVRDNDPTKMNFNDAVKGFCMYNDCLLSEDGLQEGYVVIFDMKGVQLGHLARVSLPALRCFMLYIQEGHPCRLKSIHILNTASWIHHVMRLVIPLVKSELLNMVKFHKGNFPEGLPLDILPMDYGGEAPSIEDLDKETETLVQNYHQWMIETEQLKSDESKRAKKASWWGFFNGNKTNDVELDEKTILKNLQID